MRTSTHRLPVAVGVLLMAAGLAACDAESVDEPDTAAPDPRVQVREAASTVLDRLVADLSGNLHSGSGHYAGCSESVTSEVDAVRYAVRARVDPGPDASPPLLSVAEAALAAAGFTDTTERDIPGGRSRGGKDDDITAAITERTGSPWLIVDVGGPCVEVDDGELLNRAPDDLT